MCVVYTLYDSTRLIAYAAAGYRQYIAAWSASVCAYVDHKRTHCACSVCAYYDVCDAMIAAIFVYFKCSRAFKIHGSAYLLLLVC